MTYFVLALTCDIDAPYLREVVVRESGLREDGASLVAVEVTFLGAVVHVEHLCVLELATLRY